ncbi:MAG TPA: hypothetical protein VJN64_01450 [Terriglobales bacterium]|nr:hypothetical protein [Terriglobales bacterium]
MPENNLSKTKQAFAWFFIVAGCCIGLSLIVINLPAVIRQHLNPPRAGWALSKTESFVLQPGQSRTFGPYQLMVQSSARSEDLRYDVESTLPIGTGLVAGDLSGNVTPGEISCSADGLLSSQRTCPIKTGETETIFVVDRRQGSDLLSAALLSALGAKSMMENSVAPNRVTIRLYEWQCLNCAKTR